MGLVTSFYTSALCSIESNRSIFSVLQMSMKKYDRAEGGGLTEKEIINFPGGGGE